MVICHFCRFFNKYREVKINLGVSLSLSVEGRAIRHSLHSAIASFRSDNTSYPLRISTNNGTES